MHALCCRIREETPREGVREARLPGSHSNSSTRFYGRKGGASLPQAGVQTTPTVAKTSSASCSAQNSSNTRLGSVTVNPTGSKDTSLVDRPARATSKSRGTPAAT
jgi:hypothetical protein